MMNAQVDVCRFVKQTISLQLFCIVLKQCLLGCT